MHPGFICWAIPLDPCALLWSLRSAVGLLVPSSFPRLHDNCRQGGRSSYLLDIGKVGNLAYEIVKCRMASSRVQQHESGKAGSCQLVPSALRSGGSCSSTVMIASSPSTTNIGQSGLWWIHQRTTHQPAGILVRLTSQCAL